MVDSPENIVAVSSGVPNNDRNGVEIRQFIVAQVAKDSHGIAAQVAEQFGISRQAASRHLQRLVSEGVLTANGATRAKRYQLYTHRWRKNYAMAASLAEDVVWDNDLAGQLASLSKNAKDIWHYAFTEMLNNAIEHSAGSTILVRLEKTAVNTRISISDNGVGIFKKIQAEQQLADERHAVLALAKGKFTTDPDNHSGEGIFFTSRIMDRFVILSGQVHFSHEYDEGDWISSLQEDEGGTYVVMQLDDEAPHTLIKLFNNFASKKGGYAFSKTKVPVHLAQYGDDKLVSRSQAKRLLLGLDKFKTVILDFEGIATVGQAFADEVFRVFVRRHSQIKLTSVKATPEVEKMIKRARSNTS